MKKPQYYHALKKRNGKLERLCRRTHLANQTVVGLSRKDLKRMDDGVLLPQKNLSNPVNCKMCKRLSNPKETKKLSYAGSSAWSRITAERKNGNAATVRRKPAVKREIENEKYPSQGVNAILMMELMKELKMLVASLSGLVQELKTLIR